jgi:hypothetical protein
MDSVARPWRQYHMSRILLSLLKPSQTAVHGSAYINRIACAVLTLLCCRASYVDGAMAENDGVPTEPKACAGNDGTIITVCAS